jgi:hypothetical protein
VAARLTLALDYLGYGHHRAGEATEEG